MVEFVERAGDCPETDIRLELHAILDGPVQQALPTKRKQRTDKSDDDQEDDPQVGTSERVWHGMNKVEALWRRDKTPWTKADLYAHNTANTRLMTPVPTSSQSTKRRPKRAQDPMDMQSTAYIRVSGTVAGAALFSKKLPKVGKMAYRKHKTQEDNNILHTKQ